MYKDEFLHYLASERNYSPATVTTYETALNGFEAFVEGQGRNLDWCDIQEGDIREWMVAQINRGSASSVVNLRLSALRSFYRYLLQFNLAKHDPTAKITGPKKKKALPYYIKEKELDRLFDEVQFPDDFNGKQERLILLTFYSTGIRLAELVSLDVADVNLESSMLKVTGKRSKQRIVPFGKELQEEMKEFIALRSVVATNDVSSLFITKRAKRITRMMVYKIVEKYLSLVTSQKKRSPHALRHSFATAMLNHGAEIEVVKELLGHVDISTTEIYTHTTFEELKKNYINAHPRA